jgi:hypothetical protein
LLHDSPLLLVPRRSEARPPAIEAGGDVAAEVKWERLYDETLDVVGSRYGLCQLGGTPTRNRRLLTGSRVI